MNSNNEASTSRKIGMAVILGLAQNFLNSSGNGPSSANRDDHESSPLLHHSHSNDGELDAEHTPCEADAKTRGIVWGGLTLLFVGALVLILGFQHVLADAFLPWIGMLPRDPMLAALAILDSAPVIVSLSAGPSCVLGPYLALGGP